MADELDGLLARVDDPALREDLRAQIDRIRAKRTFGLVFESHLPERVVLPEHGIRLGASVVLRDDAGSVTYQVLRVHHGKATVRKMRHPDGSRLSADEDDDAADEEYPVDELVVIADFGEPIYPGLRPVGSIDRGGDKPAHVVIKGENHHVLEALQFTHAGKIDCIYIDPPFNTGARDWKYDNNYVDDTDVYRHSKWLAFMERRLLLAKELLNPTAAVLIVAIDENEMSRLALLLEQTFPGLPLQVVTSVINPRGRYTAGRFLRTAEYYFFVTIGSAVVAGEPDPDFATGEPVPWRTLRRSDIESRRGTAKGGTSQFYPIYVNQSSATIEQIGEPLRHGVGRDRAPAMKGCVAVFPIRDDGTEMNWGLTSGSLRSLLERGFVRVGRETPSKPQKYEISYLTSGRVSDIEEGRAHVTGYEPSGAVTARYAASKLKMPRNVWDLASHNAEVGGTNLIKALLGDKRFDYPKSLFAVEDCLGHFLREKTDAVVLDFFGGSGTTAHAVARLNRQDAGRRQSIVVTNNEVSAAEAESLRKQEFQPGDPEWEALGIFEHVTRPRITAAVTGMTPDGEPVKGDYKFTDEFPIAEGFEENVTFAELVYLDPDDVELDLAFAAIAPLLWLRAGAEGRVIDECLDTSGRRKPYAWTERYGVLFNPDRWRGFVEKMPAAATTAFVVTDSQAIFAGVAAELPDHLDVVRLYENYLTTFRINEGLG